MLDNMMYFRLVIETLDKVDKDRRCFRLVGGVLVERKVGEVEPALIGNKDKVSSQQQSNYILQGLLRIKISDFSFCKTLAILAFVKSANLYSPFYLMHLNKVHSLFAPTRRLGIPVGAQVGQVWVS